MQRPVLDQKWAGYVVAAVTHDLRMPLTSIKASITTLLDEVRGRMNALPIGNEEHAREIKYSAAAAEKR